MLVVSVVLWCGKKFEVNFHHVTASLLPPKGITLPKHPHCKQQARTSLPSLANGNPETSYIYTHILVQYLFNQKISSLLTPSMSLCAHHPHPREKLLDFLWSVKQPDGSFVMHVGGEVDVRWEQSALFPFPSFIIDIFYKTWNVQQLHLINPSLDKLKNIFTFLLKLSRAFFCVSFNTSIIFIFRVCWCTSHLFRFF